MTISYSVDLRDCEELVQPGEELLYRQVTPHKWDARSGKPGSAAFGPSNADAQMASFARSTKTSAQAARDWHQKNAASPSMGVWACSSADVNVMQLRVVDDSECEPTDDEPEKSPGHCYVDFRGLEKKRERDVRKFLLAMALARKEIPTTDLLADQADSEDDVTSAGSEPAD